MSWWSRTFGGKSAANDKEAVTPSASSAAANPPESAANDSPITTPEQDTLGRAHSATAFAGRVLTLDGRDGAVVGVLGPWGSGKTSFINLARPVWEKAGAKVVDFNPWMFSGTEQLVESFFVELAAQLKIHKELEVVGKDLEEYGEAFSSLSKLPVVGPWIEGFQSSANLIAKLLERRKQGTGDRRKKLSDALAALKHPLIVVTDDVERLTTPEIRDIFKLIRVTVSFPNLIYVIAFDRIRVEAALEEQNVPGREYLEKILLSAYDLPAIPDSVLKSQIFAAVDRALNGIKNLGKYEETVWADVFMEIVRPLVRHMRDVKRYGIAIRGTVVFLNGQIAVADVLGMEAVRVFLPEVFAKLHDSINALTVVSGSLADSGELKVEGLIKAGGETHDGVVRAMIKTIFPSAALHIGGSHYDAQWQHTWQTGHRMAHEEFLRLYLEGVADEGVLAFNDAETASGRLSDRVALDSFLRKLDPVRLADVINSLEAYEKDYKAADVVPASIVLLNLLPAMPEKSRQGFLVFGNRMVVTRVVYRLLRSLKEPAAIETAVRAIMPEVTNMSGKHDLITIVGYDQDAGQKLVTEQAAKEFEAAWRAEVRAASPEALAAEMGLLQIVISMKHESTADEPMFVIPDSPAVTLNLLKAGKGQVTRQSFGHHGVRTSPRLAWDLLTEIFGTEETLRQRIESLRKARLSDDTELWGLVDKYMGGWRPTSFEN